MRKPVTRAPKPPRRHLILPTLAENITIMRGIAADPDNPAWTKADFRQARPLSELLAQRARRMGIQGPIDWLFSALT